MEWFEKAELQLGADLDNGDITEDEYKQYMSDLLAEYEQARCDAAEEAYNNY